MHFSRAFLAAFFAALAAAQATTGENNSFEVPENGGYQLTAGQPQVFNWGQQTGDTVTLRLRYGNTGDLDDGDIIVSNIPNTGTYTWDVPDNIAMGTSYTVEIVNDQDENDTNFTPPFTITSDVTGEPGLPDDNDDDDDDSSSTTATITSSASTSSATDSSSTGSSTTDDDDDDSSTSTTSTATTTSSNEPTPTGNMAEVPGESDEGAAAAVKVGGSLLAVLGAMFAVM